jgi:Holliday junction resolvase RusA-like endonuclease
MKMSKFVTIAVANSKEETAKEVALATQPVLKAKLEAKIQAQKAVIIEKAISLKEADKEVEKATGFVTKNVDNYLERLFDAMTYRDEIAEDHKQAETLLEELEETLKVFI